jgi:hypothetical protein
VVIVTPAPEFDVRNAGFPARRVWPDVMELHEAALAAPAAADSHEGAAPQVA